MERNSNSDTNTNTSTAQSSISISAPIPTPSAQIHFVSHGPSQNIQGNVNSTFNQYINVPNHPAPAPELEPAKTRSPDQLTEPDGTGETKAQVVSRHLKGVNLTTFLRPHLLELCQNTKNLDCFVLSLVTLGVMSQTEADACDKLADLKKKWKYYEIAGQTGYGDKLVEALESSENHHIIEKIYSWIKK